MIREFRAMGTDWWVRVDGGTAQLLDAVVGLVEEAEQRFSRFRLDSTLSTLNRERQTTDGELAALTRESLRLGDACLGAFNPSVGGALLAAGYDRSFDKLPATVDDRKPGGRPGLLVRGDTVTLAGEGSVDFGGIAKGWTVDRAGELLRDEGCPRFIIDAGGDILVGDAPGRDPLPIGLGDLAVGLEAGAVATSSTLRRRWATASGTKHHIIDPRTSRPSQRCFAVASVVAPTATVADALATALIADPDATLPALEECGAEALLEGVDGSRHMTPGLQAMLL